MAKRFLMGFGLYAIAAVFFGFFGGVIALLAERHFSTMEAAVLMAMLLIALASVGLLIWAFHWNSKPDAPDSI